MLGSKSNRSSTAFIKRFATTSPNTTGATGISNVVVSSSVPIVKANGAWRTIRPRTKNNINTFRMHPARRQEDASEKNTHLHQHLRRPKYTPSQISANPSTCHVSFSKCNLPRVANAPYTACTSNATTICRGRCIQRASWHNHSFFAKQFNTPLFMCRPPRSSTSSTRGHCMAFVAPGLPGADFEYGGRPSSAPTSWTHPLLLNKPNVSLTGRIVRVVSVDLPRTPTRTLTTCVQTPANLRTCYTKPCTNKRMKPPTPDLLNIKIR